MMMRVAKVLLLAGIAFFYTLVVFTNLTDYNSNAQFVRHVLLMDTTFAGNHAMWRSISSPAIDFAFFATIIAWEAVTAVLLWWGIARLLRALRSPAAAFNSAKSLAVLALTVSSLLWLVAFLDIGGEWFLMWQSPTWNGQQKAFMEFTAIGIVFLLLVQPDTDAQP